MLKITLTTLIPVLVLSMIFIFFAYYWLTPKRNNLKEWARTSNRMMNFGLRCHPMEKKDRLPLLLLIFIYGATAFFQLGSFTAPQNALSFQSYETIELVWHDQHTISQIDWYSGLGTGNYKIDISSDGERWLSLWQKKDDNGKVESYYWADGTGYNHSYAVNQTYSSLFKWNEIVTTNPQHMKFMRITTDKDQMQLGELVLWDRNGTQIPTPSAIPNTTSTSAPEWHLFDEQNAYPESSSWFNSTYFDEIYHARTALEHIEGVSPYEVSHPPLGKLILSIGIQLFGMTPFGWRFMGTLFGVLMLPLLYVFLKNMFGKTTVALCGTALFAFDFMHLTQTRIATIDTYGVFFILAMYFFLYRFLVQPAGTKFSKTCIPLLLSGLCWGLGAASKWTVIYGAVGLAILYFIGIWFKYRDWPKSETSISFGPWVTKTLLLSVLAFVVLPVGIYTASYIPYAQAKGIEASKMFDGASVSINAASDKFVAMVTGSDEPTPSIPTDNLVGIVLENQRFMFTYHEGVTATHPYSSSWPQWLVNGRPILYYLDNSAVADTGMKTAFGSFNNPVLSWAGLLAMVTLAIEMFRKRSGTALFILIAYLSQLVPWMFIGRVTFAYHYFPCALFLAMGLAYLFDQIIELRGTGWKPAIYGLTGGAIALYAAFYPVLIGLTAPTWYTTNFLKWFSSWPY